MSLEKFLKERYSEIPTKEFKKSYKHSMEEKSLQINSSIKDEELKYFEEYIRMEVPYKLIAELFSVSSKTVQRRVKQLEIEVEKTIHVVEVKIEENIFQSIIKYKPR